MLLEFRVFNFDDECCCCCIAFSIGALPTYFDKCENVCGSVATFCLHATTIIHGCFKPKNILIRCCLHVTPFVSVIQKFCLPFVSMHSKGLETPIVAARPRLILCFSSILCSSSQYTECTVAD